MEICKENISNRMKNNKKSLLHLVMFGAAMSLVGCSSTPSKTDIAEEQAKVEKIQSDAAEAQAERRQEQMEQEMKNLPGWVLDPPKTDGSGFYGVGIGSDRDLVNSMRKAKLQASYELAKTMKSELSGEDTMTGSGEGEYRYVINNFVDKVNLSGAQVVKQKVEPINGMYKSYVLMKYPYNDFNQVLKDSQANDANKKTLEDAYQRLMKKIGRE
ncbi:hypothetical protein [Hydrogenovibrio sp. JE_KL2]|uniref:hypothetical protein n=1 Tax=Hydrogenovibrio sp. JE_KL2 TaxID=2651188 RepID=UPI00128DD433|nr:hypothetical protein [Hydrogenovibrio sp. JE_KL2]MBD3822212.1 hypothetical protein [Thiotrichales bacterium]MPQ75955.1 hypothetical protein [Hydrogenovibrio sp. JE_KL2]